MIINSIFLRTCTILLLSIIFFPSCVTTISGKLYTDSPSPSDFSEGIVNIVSLGDDQNKMNEVVKINPDGTFKSSSTLGKGDYLVEILVPGYEIISQNVTLKDSANISFKLTKDEAAIKTKGMSLLPINRKQNISGNGEVSVTPPKL